MMKYSPGPTRTIRSPLRSARSIPPSTLGFGWKQLSWFGIFNGNSHPWVYHTSLGWILPVEDTVTSLWIWKPELGWLWSDASSFPRMFHSNTQSWVYIHDNGQVSRWNASTEEWEAF